MITKTSTSMSKRVVLALFAVFALFGAIIIGGSTANAVPATVTVGQTNGGGATGVNQFNAAAVTIVSGESVTWNSALDNRSHDVTAYAEAVVGTPDWQSPTLRSGTANTTFSRVFTTGTYTYYCSLHAGRADAAPGVIDANIAAGAMVGKITVTAPTPDTAAPTVSAVAAAPNPTNGAGSVSLTATVTDTTNGGVAAAVASARYRIDAGAAVAMSATDGSFNSASEGVTASVPVGALSLGVHTVEVQGTDASGNLSAWVALAGGLNVTPVPAGSIQATVTLTAGGLTNNTQPGITFGSVALTGSAQVVAAAAAADPWRATDARGNSAGWNVTIAASDFSATGVSPIPAANLKTQIPQASITPAGPVSQALTFQPLGATALKVLNATGAAGNGGFDYRPDFQLTIPASAGAGSYTANVTVSINSGP